MKQEMNVFGERICIKERCPAYHHSEKYGEFCNARLGRIGRIKAVNGKTQYGQLCQLPLDFKVVMNEA